MVECRKVAEKVIEELKVYCTQVAIAGSLRRGEESSHDVDIVCADPNMPTETERIERFTQNGCDIDAYHAHPDHFGPMMLTYTGPSGANIGMRVQASKKGLLLNQYGLFDRATGERKDDNTEDDICQKVLNRPCKPPEDR